MKNNVFIDDLTDWSLYLNDDSTLNEDLLESIMTISKGFIDDIGLVIIGDSSFYLFNIDKKIDFDLVNKDTIEAMEKTLKEQPDFQSGLLVDISDDVCGGLIQMNSGVFNVINNKDLVMEDDNINFGCSILARTKLLMDCENNKIYGYLIPKSYFKESDREINND